MIEGYQLRPNNIVGFLTGKQVRLPCYSHPMRVAEIGFGFESGENSWDLKVGTADSEFTLQWRDGCMYLYGQTDDAILLPTKHVHELHRTSS